jgi:hypothetical protein
VYSNLSKPDHNRCERQEGAKSTGQFIKASGQTTVMLSFVEKALYQMLLKISLSYLRRTLRFFLLGITTVASCTSNRLSIRFVSYARSDKTCFRVKSRLFSFSYPITESWICPGVSSKHRGFPKASTRAWILVVNPPLDRPIVWNCCPLLLQLMEANNRYINHFALEVRFDRNFFSYLIPYSGLLPSVKLSIHGRPGAVIFWHITPRCTCTSYPKHDIEHLSIVFKGSLTFSIDRRIFRIVISYL